MFDTYTVVGREAVTKPNHAWGLVRVLGGGKNRYIKKKVKHPLIFFVWHTVETFC